MAFSLKGAGGSANSATANQASTTLTTATTNGAAGDLAVLRIAVDNNQTTDGDESAVTSVSWTAGTWVKAAEFTNGQGSAQAGATCSVWYCNLNAAFNTGGTITINFANAASRDASACALEYFTMAAGKKASVEATNTLAADGAAAGSLDATTSNIACLRIRAIASESSTATALTKTAAFTAVLGQNLTTGGGSASNMGVRGEYLISTGTGQASNPTAGAGSVDHASVYVAFKEVNAYTLAIAQGSLALTGQAAALTAQRKLAFAQGSYAWSIANNVTTESSSSGSPYTFSVAQGSYSLTGQTNILAVKMPAVQGSYSLSGQSVSFIITVVGSAGSYALSGQTVNLVRGRTLTAAQGSYSLSGQSATFKVSMPAVFGSYTLSGQSANLVKKSVLISAQGAYALSGQAAGLVHGYTLTAAQGSYSLSGQTATFKVATPAISGSYTLSGQSVAFLRSYVFGVANGSYSLSGQSVNLLRTYKFTVDQGAYSLTGEDAGLTKSSSFGLAADFGSYALSGQNATFNVAMVAVRGSYTLSGQSAALVHGYTLTLDSGSYSLTGQAANLAAQRKLSVSQGSYSLSGQSARLVHYYSLAAQQGSYSLTGESAGLARQLNISASEGNYVLSGQDATLNVNIQNTLTANKGSFSLTGNDVGFIRQLVMSLEGGTYSLAGGDAVLTQAAPPPPSLYVNASGSRSPRPPQLPRMPLDLWEISAVAESGQKGQSASGRMSVDMAATAKSHANSGQSSSELNLSVVSNVESKQDQVLVAATRMRLTANSKSIQLPSSPVAGIDLSLKAVLKSGGDALASPVYYGDPIPVTAATKKRRRNATRMVSKLGRQLLRDHRVGSVN